MRIDDPSGVPYIIVDPSTTSVAFCLTNSDGRTLLKINSDGTIEGELEDMGEAARLFVQYVRSYISLPTPLASDQQGAARSGCGLTPHILRRAPFKNAALYYQPKSD